MQAEAQRGHTDAASTDATAADQQRRKPFKCLFPGCEKYFTKRSNLTQHMHIHTGERPFQCEVCGSTFRQRGNLTKHLRSHKMEHLRWRRDSSDKPFKCPYECGKSFTAKSSLQVHIRTHTGELPFQCTYPDCNERFHHKAALANHTRQHEEMQQKQFHCMHPNCKMCFLTVNELREHVHQYSPGLVAENCFLRQSVTQLLSILDDLGGNNPEVKQKLDSDSSVNSIKTAMANLPAVQTAVPRPSSQADQPMDSYLSVLWSYIGELDDDDSLGGQLLAPGDSLQNSPVALPAHLDAEAAFSNPLPLSSTVPLAQASEPPITPILQAASERSKRPNPEMMNEAHSATQEVSAASTRRQRTR